VRLSSQYNAGVTKRRAALGGLVLAAASATACGRLFTTPIRDVLDDPAGYEGKTVTVAGVVLDSANLILVKYYRVEDATGRITVVARGAVPPRGARARVRGRVHQAFVLGDQSLTVIEED
jgi:hypothetical protein